MEYFDHFLKSLCNDFSFDTDFLKLCLEDPTAHRLTNGIATIDVVMPRIDTMAGYWKWMEEDGVGRGRYVALSTRYQPQNCRIPEELNTARCQSPLGLDRFSPYQFVYNDGVTREEIIRTKVDRFETNNDESLKICFVGISHAREMNRAVNKSVQKWNVTKVITTQMDAQFPRIVKDRFINRYIRGKRCDKTVIAEGQWSAGRKPVGDRYRSIPATLFPAYRDEVEAMILRLQKSGVTEFILCSIHYNPLGDLKTTCPPKDWRSPPVIDMYNDIIRNLTEEMNVPYIGTNFIIGPMWDSAKDICHYKDETGRVEALYMLDQLVP